MTEYLFLICGECLESHGTKLDPNPRIKVAKDRGAYWDIFFYNITEFLDLHHGCDSKRFRLEAE